MSRTCFTLNNSVKIKKANYQGTGENANLIYSFNNNYSNTTDNALTTFGLYDTTSTIVYYITNVPKSHPMGFFDASAQGTGNSADQMSDITNLITYDVSYANPIKIYVSSGSDLPHGNNNYYNFYDESYNLININTSYAETTLTNSGDNFHFMRNMKYQFIAIEDFSTSHPFSLSGENFETDDLSLQKIDDSFNIIIPTDANNTTKPIHYQDVCGNADFTGVFSILVDASNITYLYGVIQLTVEEDYSNSDTITETLTETYTRRLKDRLISIQSFPNPSGVVEVSNTNLFHFNDTCDYVIAEQSQFRPLLKTKNQECLNIVSQAKLIEDPGRGVFYYEFNLNNHGTDNTFSVENLYETDYGIYDGSYTVFNIDPNHPITLDNIDISNSVKVDEDNTTGIIYKTDQRIQALGAPYNKYNYYFNTVRLIVNNERNELVTNDDISLLSIDLLSSLTPHAHYELSNTLFYTTYCEDSDNVNFDITSDIDLSFVLYNQQGSVFTTNFMTPKENIYTLNLYQDYNEPTLPYKALDRYNHDISNLITSTLPATINFNLSSFVITYTVEDYEGNTAQLRRLVEIHRGPFIEISGTLTDPLFLNSNPLTNRFIIESDTHTTYNVHDNINAYVYDTSVPPKKINLPFEITLVSGDFYDPSSIFGNTTLNQLTTDNSINILKYNNILATNEPLKSDVNTPGRPLNYYLSKNFNLEFKDGQGLGSSALDELGIEIINVKSFNIDNENSRILEEANLINFNGGGNISYVSLDLLNDKILSFNLDAGTNDLIINKIDSSDNIIDISQSYEEYALNTSLTITNIGFVINIIDTNNSDNNLNIDGSFDEINLFGEAHMNSQYIGDYDFAITVKGLSSEDHIFNSISDNIDINSLDTDFSRIYTANITDTTKPELNFKNNGVNAKVYTLNYSNDNRFLVFDSITTLNRGDQFLENSNRPLIEASDNSIYGLSYTYSVDGIDSLKLDGDIYYMDQTDKNGNAHEPIITYSGVDLLGNKSNDVSLTIVFKDFPDLQLIGDQLVQLQVFSPHIEDGVRIKPGKPEQEDYVPGETSYSAAFLSDFQTIHSNPDPADFNISYSTNIDITTVGRYFFTYQVRSSIGVPANNLFNSITRFIQIVDTGNPYLLFPILTPLGSVIDGSNDTTFSDTHTGQIPDAGKSQIAENIYTGYNAPNIDFSLSVLSSFDDLSYIIYTLDLRDNYFTSVDLSLTVSLSIGGREASFTEAGLKSVAGTNNKYLNDDNSLNKVTNGLNKADSLIFNYKVHDRYDNSFNVDRIVDIVDNKGPSIDFSFNYNNITDVSYVLFSETVTDFKDFSYQAFNKAINYDLFIMELSSIIFDFTLVDTYEISSNNYTIRINNNTTGIDQSNIKTMSDITNNSDTLDFFSRVDSSLDIIYEISDNQFNTTTIIRKVDIINQIAPLASFTNPNPNINQILIDFGDNSYNIADDFNISHPRLFETDVPFDISFSLGLGVGVTPNITTISGNYEFDPAGMIYTVTGSSPTINHDISCFAVTKQSPFDLSSSAIAINVLITNQGPIFDDIGTIIPHEAGEFFSDASFLFGVNAVSEYDKFYHFNNSTDISYLFTNFTTYYDKNSFDVTNPVAGIYNVSYTATDENNKTKVLTRQIRVSDTEPPVITLSVADTIYVNRFEELYMPTAYFSDIGAGLSSITIRLKNTTNDVVKNIADLVFPTLVKNYTFSQSALLLDTNDTSNSDMSYQLIFNSTDRVQNSSQDKILNIAIELVTDFIIIPKLSVSGYDYNHEYNLDDNFNTRFNALISNNTDNLAAVFNSGDVHYNSTTKTITYEVGDIDKYNLINYTMTATFGATIVDDGNNTIVNNITPNTIGNYNILYQSFDDTSFKSFIEVIKFNIVDTAPPDLSFVLSTDYPDISNIKLPLLSTNKYNSLTNNTINGLVNQNLSNPYLFTKGVDGHNMYSLPGVNITDAGGGTSTISLSNETLEDAFDSTLAVFTTYKKLLPIESSTSVYDSLPAFYTAIDNSLTTININPNLLDSYIDVTINHADVNFNFDGSANVTFIYRDGTVHTFKHRGNGAREFYNYSNVFGPGWMPAIFQVGDHSSRVINPAGDTITFADEFGLTGKDYYIYCSSVTGVSTWTFRALSGDVSSVVLEEYSIWGGMIGVTVTDNPLFDISASYLLKYAGDYIQNYQVFDSAGNSSDISRVITVERFDPFLNLNYTQDASDNLFLKTYHPQYTPYIELLGNIYDYYETTLPSLNIEVTQLIDEKVLGIQKVKLQLTDANNVVLSLAERDVHVVKLKCLTSTVNDLSNLIPDTSNNKFGLYDNSYTINITDASDAIRLVGNNNIDITGMIYINGSETPVTNNGNEYHWGKIDVSVNSNFNRASIEYLNRDLSVVFLEDVFLYSDECVPIIIEQTFKEPLHRQTFLLDVSGYNSPDNSYQYFTLTGEIYQSTDDINNRYITDLSRATLHLPIGEYTFTQLGHRNYYNRIKFSITEDGTHNNGVEFTKGITEYGTPGVTNGKTEFLLSATTPSPLYYYSEHFPNMGGKIETRNNIVFSTGNMYVTDNVLSVDNAPVLPVFNSQEELLNRLLISQSFNIVAPSGTTDKFNVNCITQQNINHNVLINKSSNLIIFKKYQSSSNYDPTDTGVITSVPTYDDSVAPNSDISNGHLKHDLSNHYLFDVSVNMSQSNMIMYDYKIDTSTNILNNTKNSNYTMSILDLFYSKGVIDNYENFFKKNRLLASRFVKNNFISKINEIKYENPVSILDNYQIYQFYLNNYLPSSKIIFNEMLNNFITFNLQTYIDLSNSDIDSDLLNHLYNRVFTKYETPSNYLPDKSNLLFEEYVVSIWTDISGDVRQEIVKSDEESILLSNGTVEINEYLLDSQDSSGLLYKIYDNMIETDGIDAVDEELKNRVFLSVRDASMIGHDYNQYIGITSQNIFHNMYIDEDNTFIFHTYQELANNFKVNEPTLTLERTLTDFSNNKKYLLELSTNDLYGCYVDSSKNIYENANKKNNVIQQDTYNYKSFISYFFGDELPNNDYYLGQFDIRPQTLNDVCYNKFEYAYDSALQNYHSHSYVIDLNDYFDRYMYDNSNLAVPWNVYNNANLKYTIVDLSYINEFNLFDVDGSQNIIFDKSKVVALNKIQNQLAVLNFRLGFISDIITNQLTYKHIPNSYNPDDHLFVNNTSIQNLIALYNETDTISNVYNLELENRTLNNLYSNNFNNFKKLKEKYRLIEEIFKFHQNTEFVSPLYNIFDDVDDSDADFNNVDQLVTDVSSIGINIDLMLDNNFYFYYDEDTLGALLRNSTSSIITEMTDYDILFNLLADYTDMKLAYENILFEFDARHLNESLFSDVAIIDLSYADVFNKTDILEFTTTLLNNYVSLNEVLNNQIAFSNINVITTNHTGADDLCNNSFDPGFNYTYDQTGIVLVDLSNNINHVRTNFNYFLDAVVGVYDFINKERIYDERLNYHMSGSKLLINSFYSNNLQFKLDIRYDSYLYPSKYVDRIVLDLAVPDFTPPTLLFNDISLSFSQSLSTAGSIDDLIDVLIADISFIEVNQYHSDDASSSNTSIIYNDVSENSYTTITYTNKTYSTINIDVSNLYNGTANYIGGIAEIDIFYTVTDNANNVNTVKRTVYVESSFEYPAFFINGIPYDEFILSLGGNRWTYNATQGVPITDRSILNNITALDTANNNQPLHITVKNTLVNTDTLGLFTDAITLTATSNSGVSITTTIYRDILVKIDDGIDIITNNPECPCPVYYKKIQHNYKLGSGASNTMRLAKVILTRR